MQSSGKQLALKPKRRFSLSIYFYYLAKTFKTNNSVGLEPNLSK
jgi:hypothetical protein